MKFLSLARAMFSQGMELLAYRTKATDSKAKKFLFPLGLISVIIVCVGYYAYISINFLSELGLAELLPIILIIVVSIASLLEGVYKTQGMLFECKDDDLLFSLPIPRSRIFALRVIKLLNFQVIFNAVFMVPAFVVYALIIKPDFIFYPISLLMLFLVPLIPTTISIIVGYVVKSLSIRFCHQKTMQIIFTFAMLGLVMVAMTNFGELTNVFTENITSISEIGGRVYYPAGAYARLINNFSWVDLIGLLASCILPLILTIYLCSIRYFKIISKTSADSPDKKANFSARQHSKTLALIKKEMSRVLSSPVFVVNALFGPVLLVIGVVTASFKMDNILAILATAGEGIGVNLEDVMLILPLFYIGALILMAMTTFVTSSMISVEGKSFNITKGLPVDPKNILNSKILASLMLSLPLFLVSDLIFILRFSPSIPYILGIVILPILVLSFSALIGLLINLKYPKMDATNDTEVVKQSVSSFLSVLLGMIFGIASVVVLLLISLLTNFDALLLLIVMYLLLDMGLLKFLHAWGVKKFRTIEV